VVFDQMMPGRDGFALASAIRADRGMAGVRLLLLTSGAQRGDAQRCREIGIEGYLTKPASRAELLRGAAEVLNGTAAEAGAVVTRHTLAESGARRRVLLAEDNPVNQEVAATMLRRRGHTVDIVASGREAVAAVERDRAGYDLVLMDIQMPELDGVAAARAIRALPADRGGAIPIVALTAHALPEERARCATAGMTGYLTKPFRARELFEIVEVQSRGAAAGTPPGTPPTAAATVPPTDLPADLDGFRRDMVEAGAGAAVPAILATFTASAQGRLAALGRAAAAGDAAAAAAAAHALRSAAATIRAERLAALLEDVERAGRAGESARVTELWEAVERESDRLLTYLKTEAPG
jgi:CheY-like chemotaxis protein